MKQQKRVNQYLLSNIFFFMQKFAIITFLRIFLFFILFGRGYSLFALEATYYADDFEWRKTANGETFSQMVHSAAICGENLWNYAYIQKGMTWMVVNLNDRPNCNRFPDVIDLSKSAFQIFSPLSVGRFTDINATLIGENSFHFGKKSFSSDTFSPFNIILTRPLSNSYFTSDGIVIEWRVTDKKGTMMVYLKNQVSGNEFSFLKTVDTSGKFHFAFTLPEEAWIYYFVLSSGNSFQTTKPELLSILNKSSFSYPSMVYEKNKVLPIFVEDEEPYIKLPDNSWWSLHVKQGQKESKTFWQALLPSLSEFSKWKASASLFLTRLSTPSSLDKSVEYNEVWSGSVILSEKHQTYGKEKVRIRKRKWSFVFQFRVGLGEKIRKEYYVTTPEWDVKKYQFQSVWVGSDGFLIPWSAITVSFWARTEGSYKLEAVLDSGYAYFNIPLTQWTVWPILPSLSPAKKWNLEKDENIVRKDVRERINTLRQNLGRGALVEDSTLDTIAQEKAKDMAFYDYVGHWTKDGKDILEFAISRWLSHPNSISENVAGWNVNHIFLEEWLEESGSHRHSMLDEKHKKIGIGYVVRNKKTYLVQVFAE